jgi:hypothetical protein
MFNIYYINYEKAFEISMLIDNKIPEHHTTEKSSEGKIETNGSLDTTNLSKIPFLDKILPKAEIDLAGTGSRTKKVADSFKVVSTKSTILEQVYKKAIEVKKLTDSKIGNLIKIKNTSLEIVNEADILATKSLLSGILKQVPIEGAEGVDITGLLEVMLKDSAYIFSGNFNDSTITFKIPMKVDNEMESQYSISDLEIGLVTIIGIYRGAYKKSVIDNKINRLLILQNLSKQNDTGIESDESQSQKDVKSDEQTHFIDVIAVIQELTIK